MSIKVYGIPTCSTCTKARKWLDQQGLEYTFVDTKITPPDREMIQQWVATLGNKPLRNTSGLSYRAIGPQKDAWSDADWIEAFSQDAMLLKRPLFVQNDIAIFMGFRNPAALKQALI